jgi:TATA-box binding protein (TBP) (component of TFIID and TFIIIB)
MNEIDNDWESFLDNTNIINERAITENDTHIHTEIIPKSTDLYISTKTKISYLNIDRINLYDTFWNIPIISYHEMKTGVVKKQMKFNLTSEEELQDITNKLENVNYYKVDIIHSNKYNHGKTQIFKDVRKINIGLSKKDIISYRSKTKSAFYNCFVIILRIKDKNNYKEIHVKVFNTGKLEIPGIQDDDLHSTILKEVVDILNVNMNTTTIEVPDTSETVLVNSNFRCGYYIDRDIMYKLLKYKYNINATYDPCSYPGIQCKYSVTDTTTISFMIFRTGSVLIVGKCEMDTLYKVYEFLVNMLKDEYSEVQISNNIETKELGEKNVKIRKKNIFVNSNHH